jgi:predicted kinase
MHRLSVEAPFLHLTNLIEIPIDSGGTSYGWSCSAMGCDASMVGYRRSWEAVGEAGRHEAHKAKYTFAAGSLVLCVGPAGAGKSRFAGVFPYHWVVSLDEMRERLCGDGGKQEVTPQAVHLQNFLVASRMQYGETTVVDAPNVEADERAILMDLAREHRRVLAAVVFETDLDTCAELSSKRSGSRCVRPSVLSRQHGLMPTSPEALADEGFSDIRTVRVKIA